MEPTRYELRDHVTRGCPVLYRMGDARSYPVGVAVGGHFLPFYQPEDADAGPAR